MKGYLGIRVRLFLVLLILLVSVLSVHSFVLLSLTKHDETVLSDRSAEQVLETSAGKSVGADLEKRYRKHWGLAAVFIVVNALVCGVVLFFRIDNIFVRPLEKLGRVAEQYRDDGLAGFGLDFHAQGPFHALSHTLRQMLERIESDRRCLRRQVEELEKVNSELLASRKQLVRSEKLATVGKLSAGLAHEIGNPLAIVQGYLELLQYDDLRMQERRQYVEISTAELDRVGRLIGELLQFSRSDTPVFEEVVAGEFFEECLELATMHTAMRHCPVQLKMGEVADQLLRTSPDLLRQVILNLLLNAADSQLEQEEERKIDITGHLCERDGSLEIVIRDNGPGVAPELEQRLFEPFFTTKESEKGTGLGLFVSQLLVERLGGDISAGNIPSERGFAVRIVLHRAVDPLLAL